MLNLIKSELYKLYRTKAFYICGGLWVIFSLLASYYFYITNGSSIGYLNFNSISAIRTGLGLGGIFCAIFTSLFITSDFSFKTIKNTISSGNNRINIYLSKMVSVFVAITTMVIAVSISSFIIGNIFFGSKNIIREDYIGILKTILLIILVYFSMQCIYAMVGFLLKSSGGTISVNLICSIVVSNVFPIIQVLIFGLLGIKYIDLSKYWPNSYMYLFLNSKISSDILSTGLIVCFSAILISSLIGILVFRKSDIK